MSRTAGSRVSLLESVRASIGRTRRYNPGDVVAPSAVLWTDADGQWEPIVAQLRGLMPELLTLGDYSPDSRTGPAIWLRCVIEALVRGSAFPDLNWPNGTVPVIYMPDVSRQTLRAVEECPDVLKPLVELQYRGAVWTQKNGKDWTIRAFLVSDDGLGLDVAEDKVTLQAIMGARSRLASVSTTRLQGKRLEAEDFDKLMIGDTPRDLLLWLSNPDGTREEWDDGTWAAFRNRCRQEYGFDPETEGEIVGGEKLGQRKEAWRGVWERFCESPALYPGIPDLLRRSKPHGEFVFDKEPWPDENDSMESALREALSSFASMKPAEARERLDKLEADHGMRRSWAWAELGMCPLAEAMKHLAELARRTGSAIGGDSIDLMAQVYVESGYLADDAAARALSAVKSTEDVAAVQAAVRCIYSPWLDDCARNLQRCLASAELPKVQEVKADLGDCILFSDGLRFDVGQRLAAMVSEIQADVSLSWRWSGFPTVTATAKPAASPIVKEVRGERLNADFCPETKDGARLTTDRFRKLLSAAGYQVLAGAETGNPTDPEACAWTEFGDLDKLGHDLKAKLAARIDDQLALLLDRIRGLLEAGWKRVHVVTDHGWLLVPGGMPKVQLPKYLAESRWSRCASIKDTSKAEIPDSPWSWNPLERFAHAPGIHCFVAGQEYAHGGVSLQECLIPELVITSTETPLQATISVKDVQWAGLRCRIAVEPPAAGFVADLRTKSNVAGSSVTEAKSLDEEGKGSLLVVDDSLQGTMVSLVIVDASGRVICKIPTTIGGDE